MTKDEERAVLAPCPFCGGEPKLIDAAGYEVWCNCGISFCKHPDKESTVRSWNTRSLPLESKESEAEPVAWMFKVKTSGKFPKCSEFAAIDYNEQGLEIIIGKEPLYLHPTECPKCAKEKEYSESVFQDYQRVCREIEMLRREPCPKRLTKEQVIEAALNCNTSNIADVDRGESYRISAPQGEVK